MKETILNHLKGWKNRLFSEQEDSQWQKTLQIHYDTARDTGKMALQELQRKIRRQCRLFRGSLLQVRLHHRHIHHTFPESASPVVQLFLFGWGMLPLVSHLIWKMRWVRGERIHNLLHRLEVKVEFIHRLLRRHPIRFIGGTVAGAGLLVLMNLYSLGTAVVYNGQEIGTVAHLYTAKRTVSTITQITEDILGESEPLKAARKLVHCAPRILPRDELVNGEVLATRLSRSMGFVDYGYTLVVDGEAVGSTSYAGALEDLLMQLEAVYTNENTISIGFLEDVQITEGYVPSEEILNLGEIAELLSSTKNGEVTYTVVKGDTWSQIANKHGLSSKELLAMNPGYDIHSLSIGEVLTISNAVPYLTIQEVERQAYTTQIPYEITYQDDASMYQGTYKVLSKGVNGTADVVAQVTFVNGEETAREILSSVTTKEPVTEVQARGTKVRPTWYPSGSFQWPAHGHLTSTFGYRSLSFKKASTNHQGIDIANSVGTAIYAADGGTVTMAGWQSGYGYIVCINHGNGFETRYAHNSKILVSKGQKVYKGQQIAKMGSTGNSSGSHCHFEIRYNGVAKNPLNYLK